MTVDKPSLIALMRAVDESIAREDAAMIKNPQRAQKIMKSMEENNLPTAYTIGLLADVLADVCEVIELHGSNCPSDIFAVGATARGILDALIGNKTNGSV